MALRLVIAEKPSVAQTIAAALGVKGKQDGYIEGGGYLISWCVGHLVQLAEAAAYGEQYRKWQLDSLPILPEEWQYAVDPDKGKQFKTIKELMHRADVSEVVNACDAGREGELIFRFVYEVAGCKKPMRRLWISSMEDGAIKAGFASLKDGREYDALFASALCRAKADWLIGINATRLFSCLYGKTLNVGRVQTPTLKMLTDRDAAISHFQKEKYYHVRLDLSGADAASERISDKAEADALKGACEAGKAVCVSLTREKKTAAPPKLFDLTSLQRETNRIFGYTAKQTLDLAQSLYEKRLLTYPRTDSSFLTDDMGGTAADIIALLCEKLPFMAGADFTPEIAKVLDSKIIAPSPYKIKQEMQKIDPHTQKPIIGKDGKPVTEEKEVTIPAYKVVSVFDVSQTEGKELPDIAVDELTGDVDRYKDFFAALEKTSPVPIAFENIEGGSHGYYHLEDKRIAINEGMSELQTLKTAIHEIAHAKLHDIDLNAPKDEQPRVDRRTREVEAESVAYTVCQHYGLDTSDYSFGYVAGWSSGRELSELKSSLETIRSAAAEIINSIDENLAELQKAQDKEQTAGQEQPTREGQEAAPEKPDPEAAAPGKSGAQEKAGAAPKEAFTPETIYRVRRNPYSDSRENSHLLQAYVTQENGRAKMGDVLYTGTPEKCRELMGQLKSGELTEGDVKQLYAKAQETAQTTGQDKIIHIYIC